MVTINTITDPILEKLSNPGISLEKGKVYKFQGQWYQCLRVELGSAIMAPYTKRRQRRRKTILEDEEIIDYSNTMNISPFSLLREVSEQDLNSYHQQEDRMPNFEESFEGSVSVIEQSHPTAVTPKKRGRPRIHPPKDPNAPKKPRGRPKGSKNKPKSELLLPPPKPPEDCPF